MATKTKVIELQDTLPDKPSELMRAALKDLEKTENDPKYEVDMNTWHRPSPYLDGACDVCLAGSVLAKTCHVSPDFTVPIPAALAHNSKWRTFDEEVWYVAPDSLIRKLNVLDDMRAGFLYSAWVLVNGRPGDARYQESINWCAQHERAVPAYEDKPTAWKAAMLKLIDDLAAVGY